ncbi:MAG: glycine rich domain-containing protein, partial [Tenericutes bacterium]|nr:glycine rich domain-containing protein [Mycoplasmatota bacterium]
KYKIELWGAQGGNEYEFWSTNGLIENIVYGGYGAYTRGEILLNKGDILYIYVGEAGTFGKPGINSTSTVGQGAVATFNGGGAGGAAGGSSSLPYQNYSGGNSGGGATDVRLVPGSWNDAISLRSRIMVAGGGGGFLGYDFQSVDYADNSNIGSAGGLISEKGYNITKADGVVLSFSSGSLANQTSGNAFGIGGTGSNSGYTTYCAGHNGGGGGYYGGGGSSNSGYYCYKLGGGGGSSYISGHTGCVAIKSETDTSAKSGCTTGTSNNSCSIHYSNKIFTNTMMIDGRGYLWTNKKEDLVLMPSPYGYDYEKGVGHNGNGYAKITYLGE